MRQVVLAAVAQGRPTGLEGMGFRRIGRPLSRTSEEEAGDFVLQQNFHDVFQTLLRVVHNEPRKIPALKHQITVARELLKPGKRMPMNDPSILVVEDEKVIAEDIQQRLGGLGYDVAGFASDAKESLALVESLKPSLVLMDINMGGNSAGIEAADAIRKLHHVPVVFLSGYSEGEMLERAKIAEPFGYILKPFETRELRVAIEIALYRHKVEQERENLLAELQEALAKVKTLRGLLPICAYCRKVRDDKGYWTQVEEYVTTHSEATFSHGMCPHCFDRVKGELDALERNELPRGPILAGH